MPSKTRAKNAAIAARSAALPKIPKELLDQFVQGPMTAEAIQDVSMAFRKALIERALGGELSHHLGYPPGGDKPAEADNQLCENPCRQRSRNTLCFWRCASFG
jgi:hypothetical protein